MYIRIKVLHVEQILFTDTRALAWALPLRRIMQTSTWGYRIFLVLTIHFNTMQHFLRDTMMTLCVCLLAQKNHYPSPWIVLKIQMQHNTNRIHF